LFDPTVPGAVVVNGVQWQEGKGQVVKGKPVVPVVSGAERAASEAFACAALPLVPGFPKANHPSNYKCSTR
jgi:hypothetical protein